MAAVGEDVSVVAAAGRPVRAEAQNTARQPKLVAMNSKAGRASMMPVNRPAMILPTTRPRRSTGARWASSGIRTCAPVEHRPMTKATAKNGTAEVAVAMPTSAATVTATTVSASHRVSTRSASETRKNSPQP